MASTREEKARYIADAICASGPYRWVGIYDVDSANGRVSNIAWSGAGAPAHLTFPVKQGLTSKAIRTKKTVNVGDVTNDIDYLTALSNTRSEIIVPILDDAGKHIFGTIDVESENVNAFDHTTEHLLEQYAAALRPLWFTEQHRTF